MRSLGKRIVTDNKASSETDLLEMARLGSIVTPMTSFIVSESTNAYDRFGIHKDRKELDEASLQIEGSKARAIKHINLPEPEEWIMAIVCILLFFFWKKLKLNRG